VGKITHSYFGKRDEAHAEALLSYAEYGPWVNQFTAGDWELWRAHQRRLPAGVAAKWTEHLVTVRAHRVWAEGAAAMREGLLPLTYPLRFPTLEPAAGAVSRYLKNHSGVSKPQGQCEA
jgi:hypothetical protein